MSLPNRFMRKSTIVVNAVPLYHKEQNLVIYAADKLVILLNRSTNDVRKLQAHSDTVCVLQFHPTDNLIFFSAGLDGRIIEWSLPSGQKLKQYGLKLPIRYFLAPFALLELRGQYLLRHYDSQWENPHDIFKSKCLFPFAVGGKAGQLVAYTQETKLFLYWEKFRTTVCYPLTASKSLSSKKAFTCVAVHPNDFVVATANSIGEIFIWYNLASTAATEYDCEVMEDPADPLESDEVDGESGFSFDQLRQAVQTAVASGALIDYYPVHPAQVKRNLVHWHSTAVTALTFTPTGSHLLSGGLEGVLVKWDMTECLGGPQHRRFLPHLGSPLVQVTCPEGPAEDTIVVTLEHNTFHILSGAFESIYTQVGFVGMPRHWSRQLMTRVPTNLAILPKHQKQSEYQPTDNFILTNGAMGNLQLLDLGGQDLGVTKIDVTRQTIVPRDNDRKHPVLFSEVMLLAHSRTTASGFHWVVTYDRVNTSQIDDEARLIWWKYLDLPPDGKDQTTRLVPVQSTSLSHLNCPVADMEFVSIPELTFYVLLLDHRLFVYRLRSDPAYPADPLHWVLVTSHHMRLEYDKLNPSTRSYAVTIQLPPKTSEDGNSHSGENQLLLHTASAYAKLYRWSDLMDKAFPQPVTELPLVRKLKATSTGSNSTYKRILRQISFKPTPLFILESSSSEQYLVACTRPLRHLATPVKDADEHSLCFLRISLQNNTYSLDWISKPSTIPKVRCVSAHPRQPLICVGSTDGKAILFKVSIVKKFAHLKPVQTFPEVPAHPLCDRQARKRKHKAATMFVAMQFLDGPQTSTAISGLLETQIGREKGRRDLVVYGCSTASRQPVNQMEKILPPSTCKDNLLQSVAPRQQRSDRPMARKRPADTTDKEFENALRQVSKYPVHTAPAPEQLLRQLMEMEKPS